MTIWIALLVGAVGFGAAIVGALVLPRAFAPVAAIAGLIALVSGVSALGALAQRYGTPEAIIAAMLLFLAGIVAGFAVVATALPHLAPGARAEGMPAPASAEPSRAAVVLVGYAEPETYSPRMVAARQNLLADSAQLQVPSSALPFIFLAEKTRYRAVGGRTPAAAVAHELASRVAECLDDRAPSVALAWCHDSGSLAAEVGAAARAGADHVAVVPLGASESAQLDELRSALEESLRVSGGPRVIFGPPVWNDRDLPARLAGRIRTAMGGSSPAEVGVVLVDQGAPPEWERRYSAAGAVENYFDQRVRVLLCESGLSEQHVRLAWLDWQTPDVTEAVRHLAALGCTRIVVAAATIALPTLETVLDLGHAISSARVPQGVRVAIVSPWGTDDGFVDAVCASAREALGQSAAQER